MARIREMLNVLLAEQLSSSRSGAISTAIPGVSLFWVTEHISREPLLYDSGIVIIGQGHKVGYLGNRKFRYDTDTYLLLGVPVPFECETFATPDEPLLGIRIDIDLAKLHELIAKFKGRSQIKAEKKSAEIHPGLEPVKMDEAMLSVVERLLSYLLDPLDSLVLGNSVVSEVIYRVLRGEKGSVLFNLTQYHTPYSAISRSLERIHSEYSNNLSIEDLALESSMSVSSFHRAFKKVTGESPLQYLKKLRLDKAKSLLIHEQMRVNNVAYKVGYESPSQFSREFKRYFNVAPSEACSLAYQ